MTIQKKVDLHLAFKNEKIVGVQYFEYDNSGPSFDPDENDRLDEPKDLLAFLPGEFGEMGNCTNCAHFVVDRLGGGDVYGFNVDDNPVQSDEINACGGHDFAVINKRYIVDIWISLYTGLSKQIVFDMEDERDLNRIEFFYGNPENWSVFQNERKFIKPDDQFFPSSKKLSINKLDSALSLTR